MNAVERIPIYLLTVALIVIEVITRVAGGPAPHQFLNPLNVHPDFTVAAIAGTLIAVRRADLLPALLLGLAFEALRMMFLAWHHVSFGRSLTSTGVGFCCAFLMLTVLRAMRTRGAERWKALDTAAIAFALPATIPLLAFFLWLTTLFLPHAYDLNLYAFDALLPVPAAQILALSFFHYPSLEQVFWFVYHALIGVLGIYIVLERKPDGQLGGHLMSRWLMAGCLGYILYFMLPAVGPEVVFGGVFPFNMPDPNHVSLSALSPSGDYPRSTIPSLHATWAFLIVLAARKMSLPARVGALMFMIATLISTLGLRQHYLIDLVVAVPFAVAIEGLASFSSAGSSNRWCATAALGGMAMTLAWMLALRYGVEVFRAAPWLASTLVVCTLAASGWLISRQSAARLPLGSLTWRRRTGVVIPV
jgi:hypothetical protein